MLQMACLQGLQPLRQVLYEQSLGSALVASSLPLASPSLLPVEARLGFGRAAAHLSFGWLPGGPFWP